MSASTGRRYATAARYTLVEQTRNRLAFGLLVIFVPCWYYIDYLFTTAHEMVGFKFRLTGAMLHVNARTLSLMTLGLNAITLIVGFMLFVAVRKSASFDRRLVISGYPRTILILAKLTTIVAVAAGVSLYTTAVLYLFWRDGHPVSLPIVWLGFFFGALIYGGLGLLLGVLLRGDLEGFFVIIMVSLIDTFIQNPIGNPAANRDIVTAFPSFGPTQVYVAGGFLHMMAWRYLVVSGIWIAMLVLLGLAIFQWRTRTWNIHTATRLQVNEQDAHGEAEAAT